jgi:hypothetical protein
MEKIFLDGYSFKMLRQAGTDKDRFIKILG